jgi:phosphoribosylamine---glycine ligase
VEQTLFSAWAGIGTLRRMRILVLGSGGREHAIGRKLSESPRKPELHFAPGNPGMAQLGTCHAVSVEDIPGLVALAQKERIDYTFVGPETPLVLGVVDAFEAAGLKAFGPSKAAARLEGSKAFSKAFMARHNIPTASYQSFTDYSEAKAYLQKNPAPIVVKASGLAAGKGAIVCMTDAEAMTALDSMLGPKAEFGDAGKEVVIESFMQGEEASLFAWCDGKNFVFLPTAQDHKRAFDNDQGPNTGGMGAYAPAPLMTSDLLQRTAETIVQPTLAGMAAEGCPFKGILFVGLMITADGPKVVEYNCRLGDPETQCVLPLVREDLVEWIIAGIEGKLDELLVQPPERAACVVVVASEGYPGAYRKGEGITGIEMAEKLDGVQVIHAGTRLQEGRLVSSGGRVLGVVGSGASLSEAIHRAYAGVGRLEMQGLMIRQDIGRKGLQRLRGTR